ncbi:MAG: hypothetical protein E7556_06875 [Ruminococcaceae bacterium]|nr:hypothetical protein [Oscillospiraceae bacterium]
MQVIEIKTTPGKYELEVTPAKLEYDNDTIRDMHVQTTPSTLKIDAKNISVKIDSYESRKSIGLMTMGDRISYEANRGKQHAAEKTREYVDIGKQISNIHEGANIPSIIAQKRINEGTTHLVTAFFPSVGPNISWEPNDLNMEYTPTELDINWQELDRSMTYIAGSVKFNVVQRASVDIEYVGGPNYFPKSSDPSYEADAE